MKMPWRKILGDLRQYKAQWALMLIILIIGIAGVMAATNARAILSREIPASFDAANMPDLTLWLERIDPSWLPIVRAVEGVGLVERRGNIMTRVATAEGGWLPMRLTIVENFSAQRVNIVHLHGDAWPDIDETIMIEQSGRSIIAGDVGASLAVRTSSGDVVNIDVGAFVHDPAIAPSTQERMIFGYITPTAALRLGYTANFDQFLVSMPIRGGEDKVAALAESIKAVLQASGGTVYRIDTRRPHHPHAGLMTAMLRVLGIFAALALVSATALIGYLFSAWMRREAMQIAVMKTIGAQTHHIAWQYLLMALPLVLSATVCAFPLGIWLGRVLAGVEANILNIDLVNMNVPTTLLFQELALVLILPILAMTMPIVRAARKSVRQTLSDPGIATFPAITRLASRLFVSGKAINFWFGVRNAWRRPWRSMVMLLAFSAGGTLLLTTHSNYESLMKVIDANLAEQAHDIEISFSKSGPPTALEEVARGVKDSAIVEAWRRVRVNTTTSGASNEKKDQFVLIGYPKQTQLFRRPVVEGRAPQPEAVDEILVTRYLRDRNPLLRPGKEAELTFNDRHKVVNTVVKVVGLVDEIATAAAYVDAKTFDRITGLDDRSAAVRIKTSNPNIELAANALDRAYMDRKLPPAQIATKTALRDSLEEHFFVVGEVIKIVAFAIAFVGTIVLVAATAFNVVERARELAIMRTIGATRRHLATALLIEAVSVVALGIAMSIIGSILLTRTMLDAAERMLLHVSVPMVFSASGFGQLLMSAGLIVLTVWICLYFSLNRSITSALTHD
jgi:putative ABC transport system permease protein